MKRVWGGNRKKKNLKTYVDVPHEPFYNPSIPVLPSRDGQF